MEQTENRKVPTLEEILEREAHGNSPWRRAWAKAQKMLIYPERYAPEEILAAERNFLEMESGLDDDADRMEIASRNLPTTIPLLSRYYYQHFDKLAETNLLNSRLGAFAYFTVILARLLRNKQEPATIEQIVPLIVPWISLMTFKIGSPDEATRNSEEAREKIAEEVLLLCYYLLALHGYQQAYPPGLQDEPEVGEKLSVKMEVQYLKDLAGAVAKETGLEIPVDQVEVLPSGEIRGQEKATRNIINRVKNVRQLLKMMLIARENDNNYVLVPENELVHLLDTLQDSHWLQIELAQEAFNFLIKTPDKKRDQKTKRAINQIEQIATLIDKPRNFCDWLDALMILGGSGFEAQAKRMFAEMAAKVRNNPEFLDEICRHRMKNQDYAQRGMVFVREGQRLDWQYQLVADSPVLMQRLFELIETPRADTFCTACTMVANLAVNLPHNTLVASLLQRLFPDTSAVTDTVRATALRYMLESIADTGLRQRFFTTVLKTLRGTIPISAQTQQRFVKTMQLYSQVLGNEITVGEQAQNEDNPLSPPGMMFSPDQLPERDLEALREEILANRSIHISQQGNRLGQTGVDSHLEGVVAETRISRNSETRKYPLSLACLITLKMDSGQAVYLRMNKDNQLLLRMMEKNVTREEIPLEKMDYLSKLDGLFAREWQYFVLCKLRDVFVRRKSDPPANAAEIQQEGTDDGATPLNELENQGPGDQGETNNQDGAVVTDAAGDADEAAGIGDDSNTDQPPANPDPFTQVREEHDPRLDITDRAIAEMQMTDLRKDSAAEAELARTAAQRIADNLAKADQLLAPLREGKNLPEILPEDLTDLVLYQKITIDGEDYYEAVDFIRIYPQIKSGVLSLDDLYVRTVRAYTQSLPYVKRYNAAPLSPSEQIKQAQIDPQTTNTGSPVVQRHLPLTVKKKQRRDDRVRLKIMLLTETGEGYGLSMSDRRKVLILEADDTALNRTIFEKLRSRSDLEIREEVSRRVSKALERNIAGARKKLVDPLLTGREWQDAEQYFERVAARMRRLAACRTESEIERELELREKLLVIGGNSASAAGCGAGGGADVPVVKNGVTVDCGASGTGGASSGTAGGRSKLQLPQILTFEQTFNQGQFDSLGSLIFKNVKRQRRTKPAKPNFAKKK